jgi:beta-aspartyl-dipeptidase (metallo-type)
MSASMKGNDRIVKLIKGGRLFDPEEKGIKDVLIAGSIVLSIGDDICTGFDEEEIEVIDAKGKYIIPGFIDQHVHITGGGGEAGYATRCPEVRLSQLIRNGITTVVGCLGTDGTTRHMETLLAKARGLETEGLTTYIYSGSYQVPTPTITGSVRNDIILIDKVLGAGEIAVSDHRSAQPTKQEIAKLAAETRVGGMLSGKPGVLHLHMGDGPRKLSMIYEILEETEIPISQFKPTHINRNPHLLEDSLEFARMGGVIDMTSGVSPQAGVPKSIKPSKAIKYCIDNDVPITNITMSSDGQGSMAIMDEFGEVISVMVAETDSLYEEFKDLINDEGLGLNDALKVITLNPARSLKLYPRKGTIRVGSDADVVLLDDNLAIDRVIAKGKNMVVGGEIVKKGFFE